MKCMVTIGALASDLQVGRYPSTNGNAQTNLPNVGVDAGNPERAIGGLEKGNGAAHEGNQAIVAYICPQMILLYKRSGGDRSICIAPVSQVSHSSIEWLPKLCKPIEIPQREHNIRSEDLRRGSHVSLQLYGGVDEHHVLLGGRAHWASGDTHGIDTWEALLFKVDVGWAHGFGAGGRRRPDGGRVGNRRLGGKRKRFRFSQDLLHTTLAPRSTPL